VLSDVQAEGLARDGDVGRRKEGGLEERRGTEEESGSGKAVDGVVAAVASAVARTSQSADADAEMLPAAVALSLVARYLLRRAVGAQKRGGKEELVSERPPTVQCQAPRVLGYGHLHC